MKGAHEIWVMHNQTKQDWIAHELYRISKYQILREIIISGDCEVIISLSLDHIVEYIHTSCSSCIRCKSVVESRSFELPSLSHSSFHWKTGEIRLTVVTHVSHWVIWPMSHLASLLNQNYCHFLKPLSLSSLPEIPNIGACTVLYWWVSRICRLCRHKRGRSALKCSHQPVPVLHWPREWWAKGLSTVTPPVPSATHIKCVKRSREISQDILWKELGLWSGGIIIAQVPSATAAYVWFFEEWLSGNGPCLAIQTYWLCGLIQIASF